MGTNIMGIWNMAPSMKAMKAGKAMTKGALADALASGSDLKKSQCAKLLDTLATVATAEVKKSRHLYHPGPLQDQDADEASNQSREARNLRQDADCEGKASQDHCEGLPCSCFETKRLIKTHAVLYCSDNSSAVEFLRNE